MNLVSKFSDHWHKTFPHITTGNCRLLLTVSGGLDSVVQLDLIAQSGFDFVMAHCNFQLRGKESKRDEDFVVNLAGKYHKQILVKHFATQEYALQHKLSIQEAARELRYDWFDTIINSWQAENQQGFMLTAHHADDNIETMLMHFFRGTGIDGLTGIASLWKEKKLLRPLLPFFKQELSSYAVENGLEYVEDSSNAADKYTRNYFRNRLIPQIAEVYPQVKENLLHNIQRFKEVGVLYEQAVQLQVKKLIEVKGAEYHIPVLKWKQAVPLPTITWEIIKNFGFAAMETGEVIKLLDAENGAYRSSATHRIIRNRKWIIISPIATAASAHVLIEAGDEKIVFENGLLAMNLVSNPAIPKNNHSNEAMVDVADIRFPLLLRKWKQGDYFYPLGMQKKKKLGRFLIDSKLSRTEKEKVWVLESNRRIIWVIGYRLDDRYKITPKTTTALQFIFENNR